MAKISPVNVALWLLGLMPADLPGAMWFETYEQVDTGQQIVVFNVYNPIDQDGDKALKRFRKIIKHIRKNNPNFLRVENDPTPDMERVTFRCPKSIAGSIRMINWYRMIIENQHFPYIGAKEMWNFYLQTQSWHHDMISDLEEIAGG